MSEEGLFKELEEIPDLNSDTLSKLSNFCRLQKDLEIELERLEGMVQNKRKELEEVSRECIPSILNSKGLSEIRLSTGEKVIVEDKVKANIANKNILEVYKNMIKEEGGNENATNMIEGLFKTSLIVDKPTNDLTDLLITKGVEFENKKTIHPQTLKKYCKDKLGKGESIPEGISVYQYQETKIK